eukprot:26472-Eustigmatos_ZCMA.PRE.1
MRDVPGERRCLAGSRAVVHAGKRAQHPGRRCAAPAAVRQDLAEGCGPRDHHGGQEGGASQGAR